MGLEYFRFGVEVLLLLGVLDNGLGGVHGHGPHLAGGEGDVGVHLLAGLTVGCHWHWQNHGVGCLELL